MSDKSRRAFLKGILSTTAIPFVPKEVKLEPFVDHYFPTTYYPSSSFKELIARLEALNYEPEYYYYYIDHDVNVDWSIHAKSKFGADEMSQAIQSNTVETDAANDIVKPDYSVIAKKKEACGKCTHTGILSKCRKTRDGWSI